MVDSAQELPVRCVLFGEGGKPVPHFSLERRIGTFICITRPDLAPKCLIDAGNSNICWTPSSSEFVGEKQWNPPLVPSELVAYDDDAASCSQLCGLVSKLVDIVNREDDGELLTLRGRGKATAPVPK